MREYIRSINTSRLISYGIFLLSIAILIGTFVATQRVTILKDWRLTIAASEIRVGDTVTIKSEYTKLREVSGKAVRYIECQDGDNIYIRYPLNEAIADRQSGTAGTGIVVTIPTIISDVPTMCKFTIAIAYDVYPWKKVNQTNSSNEFMLLPEANSPRDF